MPDCTHHRKAKGGKPRQKHIRGLAWVVIRWARTVRPRIICLENVEEFQDWGPLTPEGYPCAERKRPPAENTMRRIAKGIQRFIIACPDPFIAPLEPSPRNDHSVLVSAFIAKHFGGVIGVPMQQPLPTILTRNTQNQLVTAHIMNMRGTNVGHAADEPLHTISAGGTHHAQVCAFLLKYYGTDQDPRIEEPLHSVTTKDRFGLVTIHGKNYAIIDIGIRMFEPHELYRAQGFPEGYIIDCQANGMPLSETAQKHMCGNSVCPIQAAAIIRANVWRSVLYEVAQGLDFSGHSFGTRLQNPKTTVYEMY